MSYCGSIPGMCGKRPDCADDNCPGKVEALLWQRSGGARVQNGVGFHFDAEDEAADEPVTDPEKAARTFESVAALAIVLLVLLVLLFSAIAAHYS